MAKAQKPSGTWTVGQKLTLLGSIFGIVIALITNFAPIKQAIYPTQTSTPIPVPVTPQVPIPVPAAIHQPKVFIVDSRSRKNIVAAISTELRPMHDLVVSDTAQYEDWFKQAPLLGQEHPDMIIVHWHMLRVNYGDDKNLSAYERDRLAEVDLLRGLAEFNAISPQTKIVLYSSSFGKQSDINSRSDINRAIERLAHADGKPADRYIALTKDLPLLFWPDQATAKNRQDLRDMVRNLLQLKP